MLSLALSSAVLGAGRQVACSAPFRHEQRVWSRHRASVRRGGRLQWLRVAQRRLKDGLGEQLRGLSEAAGFLSGFALACFVELEIPEGVPAELLVPFAAAAVGSTGLLAYCAASCALLLVALCSPAGSGEALFHECWRPAAQAGWRWALWALVAGVICFSMLAALIIFVSAYQFPAEIRNTAGLLSLGILLFGLIFLIAPSVYHFSYLLQVNNSIMVYLFLDIEFEFIYYFSLLYLIILLLAE